MSIMQPQAVSPEVAELQFRTKVAAAIVRAKTVLENDRNPRLAEDVQHSYPDKYVLSEHVGNTALAATLGALEQMVGLNAAALAKALAWVRSGASVTLRLKAEEQCAYDREEKRDEEHSTSHELKIGTFKRIEKTITTITEHFWRFTFAWEVFIYANSDIGHGFVLAQRSGKHEIKTLRKESPRPVSAVKDAIDLNLSWCLRQIDATSNAFSFSIDRASKRCRTPRRNDDVESALSFFREVAQWCTSVRAYFFYDLFQAQTNVLDTSQTGALSVVNVFVPVQPLFDNSTASRGAGGDAAAIEAVSSGAAAAAVVVKTREEGGFGMLRSTVKRIDVGAALVKLPQPSSSSTPLLLFSDVELLLAEQKRALGEKMAELAVAFPAAGVKVITVVEAGVVATAQHLIDVVDHYYGCVRYIEEMLRKQLIAAIGKEVSPLDFAGYMTFHNRKLFRDEYQPRPFSYAVRRPDHYPEGVLSIEAVPSDGALAQPIETVVAHSQARSPLRFAISASATVAFTGDVHLHASLQHSFSGSSGQALRLTARARQFSSFLVLLGRITGPGLFDPQFGFIVQNKDDIDIPLNLETIPSAKAFKEAISSLSTEQQRFAKAFRSMQLASTLFAVCTIQIKPQLERVLKLPNDALTKRIRLTQDLLELFIKYQIPSDQLSVAPENAGLSDAAKVAEVAKHVKAMMDLIEGLRAKDMAAVVEKAVLVQVAESASSESDKCDEDEEEAAGPVVAFKSMKKGGGFLSKVGALFKSSSSTGGSIDAAMRPSGARRGYVTGSIMDAPADAELEGKPSAAPAQATTTPATTTTTPAAASLDVVPEAPVDDVVDYTVLPKQLDEQFEQLDTEGAVRPTIINVGSAWTKMSRKGLLDKPAQSVLQADEQRLEKDRCYDLLDALTKGGGMPIEGATLHIVMCATHCFDKSVLKTLVEDNVNPIERVERSQLIMASAVHGQPVAQLVRPEQLSRVVEFHAELVPDEAGMTDL